jgi:hypothetical protein
MRTGQRGGEEAGQVGGSAHQAGGGLLGEGEVGEETAVGVMRTGGLRGPRPLEAAGGHAERLQHLGLHVVGERPAGELLDQQLRHAVAATRIQPASAGRLQQLDREAVARPPRQRGRDGRQRPVRGLADVAVHRESGGVAEQPTHGDSLDVQGRRRRAPPSQAAGDRLVQADPAGLDQPEHAPGGHRLGQRGGLEAGVGRHRLAGRGVGHAVAGRPDHLPVVDKRDGQPGRRGGSQRLPGRFLHGLRQAGRDGVAAPSSDHRPARPGDRWRLTGRDGSIRLVGGRRHRPGLGQGR